MKRPSVLRPWQTPWALLAAVLALAQPAWGQVITTVAGGAVRENLPAISVGVPTPPAVAADSAGNLFIADRVNHVVRRVDAATGLITTVAGNGSGGFSGDGGPATSLQLNHPIGLVVDQLGNLFIADYFNQRIRRVDAATGTMTTVAGRGAPSPGGDGGLATNAYLNAPSGVAVDNAGNLFIADSSNHRIRRVDAATGIITTVAGTGVAGFSGDGGAATSANLSTPFRVSIDDSGNLFIADRANNRIRRVDAATGIITTVAGSGTAGFAGDGSPATAARLSDPREVAVDASGNLFIADLNNNRIRRVDTAGIITTVAGDGGVGFAGDGGPAGAARLYSPYGVTVDDFGNLLIADMNNHRIRRVDNAGIITTVAGNGSLGFSGDGGPATGTTLGGPRDVFVGAGGDIFIADASNHRVRRVDAATGIITTIAGTGVAGTTGDGGPATSARLNFPSAASVDAAGNVFIADLGSQRIRRVDAATGIITTVAGTGVIGSGGDGGPATAADLDNPYYIALDGAGNLYISDHSTHRIRQVDAATGIITTIAGNPAGSTTGGFSGDGGPATGALMNRPRGIAFDSNGNLFIADDFNHRVRRVDALTGIITTVAGNGTAGFSGDGGPATSARLNSPYGVTVDQSGNLYISDLRNNRIRRVDPSGIIGTVAGTGIAAFGGDGGPATSALLSSPAGLAKNAAGDLFIADRDNHRIRRIAWARSPATITLSNLVHTYDGTPKAATATTDPPGLTVVTITYDGSTTPPTNAGSYAVVASLTSDSYEAAPATGTLVINPAAATLTLGSLAHTYDGTPKAVTVTTNPPGLTGVTVTYDGSTTPPTNAGSYAVVASLANGNYQASNATGTLVINPAAATLILSNLAHTYDGTPKAATVTTNPPGLTGVTITYNGSPTPPTNVASYAVVASLTNGNYQASNATGTLVIGQGSVTLAWSAPADIVYGTAIGAAQLNATASVSGTFVYTPPAGTVLNAGTSQTLTVTFTATDTANYNPATTGVLINVLRATPTVTWPTPADIMNGTPLGPTQLNATASVPGAFDYTPPVNTILPEGSGQTLSVIFTPTDSTNFAIVTAGVQINVLAVVRQGLTALSLFDSTGTYVGSAIGIEGGVTPILAFNIDGTIFALRVFPDRFAGNETSLMLIFETADCTGTPFVVQATPSISPILMRNVTVVAPGNTVYAPTGPAQEVAVGSTLDQSGACAVGGGGTVSAAPAAALIDLNTLFTPPFSVR